MEVQLGHPAEEMKHLERCMNELAGIFALPAVWSGGEPSEIAHPLLDLLLNMLDLDLIYVRLEALVGEAPIEMFRVAQSLNLTAGPQEIGELFKRWLGDDPQKWPKQLRNTVVDKDMTVVPVRLGLQGEIGVMVAGSGRADFPRQSERLVLSGAANQAAIGLQAARLLSEQRRVTDKLDERVAQRTRELSAANEALQQEAAERRRAEEALRESERESRLIVDNIPGLVGLLSATGHVEVVNRQLFEYFGQSLEELRQWGTNGTVHPEDLPHVVEVFTRSIESGSPYNIVQRFRRSDGVYRWFENSGFPLRDAEGHIVRWCVLLTDIDERKRAEDALRESERESRLIVDSIPGLIAVFAPGGELEFVNRQVLEYFGRTLEELKQWGTDDTTHPEDNPRVIELFTRAMASGDPFEWESRARRFDGVYRWFQSRGFPLRDTNGQIVRWYNLLIDIDERKRAEEELRESEDRMRTLAESASDAIITINHESRILFVNPAAEKVFGYGSAEMLGQDLTMLMPEYLRHLHHAGVERYLRTGSRHIGWNAIELPGLHKTGREIPLEISFSEWTSNGKQYFTGIARDISERKRAEEALAASERNLKLIIDTIPALAWSAGLDGTADFFNQHYLDFVGLTAEQASGWGWTAAVHPDDLNSLAVAWQGIMASEAPGETESRLRRHDGEYRWFLFRANPLRDERGSIVKWYGTNSDITERKLAVERLQAEQELLDLAQKSARAMAFDWHIQQDFNVWTPEQEALYGLQPGTFDGTYQSWKKLIYAPDWPLVVKAVKHAHETGVVAVEFRVQWPDGSIHWLSTNGQMFFDEQGKPFRMVGFTSDVTPRKLAEEDLRRSEAFLAEAQHLTSIGSFSWRVGTDEITWSEQLYRIYGLETGAPVTLELIRTRVHPEDLTLYEKMVEQARQGGNDFEWQYRLMMPDRTIKYLHAVAHATRDQDGELEYIAAVQDVTERRLSEEALGKLRSELAHVSRVATLGALTASIAHEVNQPLAGIITNASTCLRMLAAEPPNVDGARETARRTIRDGHRASDVITRLRALFSKKVTATESVDLNEATREVIALSQSELQRNGIILRTELRDDLPPVTGDRIQLQQVILNLLRNAVDAMSGVEDRPRQLVIRTELDEGDYVRLSVQDAGAGFDPQAADRLFEAFYTTKDEGMGIGLSVSRSIIERHQGRLWAEPNDGPGATFSFSIPRASESVMGASNIGATRTPAS